jgi:hypothetical protein
MSDDLAACYGDDSHPNFVALHGAELDHLEMVARVPELQRENAVVVKRQYGCFAPPPYSPRNYGMMLELPDHPAIGRYRTALMFAPVESTTKTDDLRTTRARFKECAEQFYTLCELRGADVEWSDGGKAVSLRAILDAEHAMVTAYHAAIDAEYREIRSGKRYYPVNGLIKTRRTVLVGEVRVPVMEKVRP